MSALINHLWQSTLFCAAIGLITLALRSNGAALRHSLWLVASLKFLVPFSALYYLGAMAGLPTPAGAQPTLFTQALQATTPVVSPTVSLISGSTPDSRWELVLALVWAAGAGVLALRWLLGWLAADSITRAARPAPGTSLDARITDAGIEPAVARVFHPVVLLPSALLGRLSTRQLDAVLAHERQHIRRHDNLTAHLHSLVQILFWFHPLVWWIGRQMLEEREQACDEAVLANGHDAHEYAEGILAVCRHCHELTQARGMSSALSGDLTRRIRGIIRHVPPASLGFCKAFALAACTLALCLTPMMAGSVEGAARRHAQWLSDVRVLDTAEISLLPAAAGMGSRFRVLVEDRQVTIRNSTMRELVAMSYGVSVAHVEGADWLDAERYDIRVRLDDRVADADNFDTSALSRVVNRLLAAHFDLQIHVNSQCQAPCGRHALVASPIG